jgi:hypothetical protein
LIFAGSALLGSNACRLGLTSCGGRRSGFSGHVLDGDDLSRAPRSHDAADKIGPLVLPVLFVAPLGIAVVLALDLTRQQPRLWIVTRVLLIIFSLFSLVVGSVSRAEWSWLKEAWSFIALVTLVVWFINLKHTVLAEMRSPGRRR